MVDAVVSFGVERLGHLLIQEAVILHGVRERVEQLRKELRTIQCFLKDADAKQQGDERIRNWVAEIREVAYDAEDVIDTFILEVARGGNRAFFRRNICIINKWIHLRKVGMEIQAILAKLENISNDRLKYDIKDVGDSSYSENQRQQRQQQLRRSYPHVEDDNVIGLKEPTEKLVAELMKEEERRCVISIVGIGGLGKTTLAKEVYRHGVVQSHFDCRAWTFLSQQFNRKDVLQDLLKKASNDEMNMITIMTEEDLVEKLHNYLRDKRYLVVLDDIWSPEAWNIISPAFPNGKKGSKIMLTTRNQVVAQHADRWSLHLEPPLLTDEESWELLYRKVFPKNMKESTDTFCSSDLEKLGRKMVARCCGLPLGVAVLGGLPVTKELEVKEWEVVLRDVNAYMNKGENGGVEGILSMSYDDLPYHLKSCFLYLGLFPEDYEIRKKKLILLWIAEGFIPEQKGGKGLPLEDVGEHQYLTELVQRSLVQVDKRGITGGVKTLRMHDLMRDLCLSKAKEANFFDIYEYDQNHSHENVTADSSTLALTTTNYRIRRHAIHDKSHKIRFDYLENSSNYSHLRTFLMFPRDVLMGAPHYHHPKLKLLRVLDLESVLISNVNIIQEVGKLIHLRYLALKSQRGTSISPSMGNLRNLQTLRLFCFRGWLPEITSRMSQLRHLHLNVYRGINYNKWRVDNLINLQTLKGALAGRWLIKGCLEKLTNLRNLEIFQLLRSQIEEIILPAIVAKSSSSTLSDDHNPLTTLSLRCKEFPNLEPLSRCDKLLKLKLSGECRSENLHFPPNLTKLLSS